jgi:hypothetical protein
MGLLINISKSVLFNEIVCLGLIFVFTYFGAAFQGNLSGFSAICGMESIKYYNLGLAIAGFGSNIISILFVIAFPTDNEDTIQKNLSAQFISYLILLTGFCVVYFFVLKAFLKYHGNYVNAMDSAKNVTKQIMKDDNILLDKEDSNQEKLDEEDTPRKLSSWKTENAEPIYNSLQVVTRILDLWLGIIFNYFITLEIVCYMIPNLTEKYQKGNQFYLLLDLFLYNLGDFLGRLLPPDFTLNKLYQLHLFNFVRGFVQIYFVYVLMYEPVEWVSHWVLIGTIIFAVGITNGFLTTKFFCYGPTRFGISNNKDLAGFLIIFGLIIGVCTGTFSGVLWNIK